MQNLSIIVPVYSGEQYLAALTEAVQSMRDNWVENNLPIRVTQLVFVDDNAIDGSGSIIDELSEKYEWVVSLHLSRNYGQHPATIAGILHSSGDWVATIDEDLQHAPDDIQKILSQVISEECDIGYGKTTDAVHESGFRDVSSSLSKRMIEFLSGNRDISKASSFRVIRGSIARAAASVCGHDTYFDVALTWFSQRFSVVHVPMKDSRFISSGKSGYTIKSLLSHGRRLLFSNQIRPLRTLGLLGLIAAGAATLGSIFVLALGVLSPESIGAPGWLSLFLLISLIGGVTLFLLGIILEYISMLVLRAHGKPLFFVVDRSGDQVLKDYFDGEKQAAC